MTPEPKIIFDPQPDPLETKVRFVCGALFGLVPATCVVVTVGSLPLIASIAVFGVSVALCALLAVLYGDDFWYGVIRVIRGLL
jgi:hypothetical protein